MSFEGRMKVLQIPGVEGVEEQYAMTLRPMNVLGHLELLVLMARQVGQLKLRRFPNIMNGKVMDQQMTQKEARHLHGRGGGSTTPSDDPLIGEGGGGARLGRLGAGRLGNWGAALTGGGGAAARAGRLGAVRAGKLGAGRGGAAGGGGAGADGAGIGTGRAGGGGARGGGRAVKSYESNHFCSSDLVLTRCEVEQQRLLTSW